MEVVAIVVGHVIIAFSRSSSLSGAFLSVVMRPLSAHVTGIFSIKDLLDFSISAVCCFVLRQIIMSCVFNKALIN